MKKVLSFFKPYSGMLILSVLFLFLQAFSNLSLPDYMSSIVNIGIQQNGIEYAIPEYIADEDFEQIKVFLDQDEQNIMQASYERVSIEGPHYELKSNVDKALLEPIMMKGFMSFYSISDSGIEKNKPLDIGSLTPEALDAMKSSTIQGLISYYNDKDFDAEKIQRGYIYKIGGFMLLITLVGALAAIVVGYFSSRIAAGMGRDLRKSVFEKVEKFSNEEIDRFSTASLITRTTNDVTQIQNLTVMIIRIVFFAPIMGIGGIIKAIENSPSMSWIIALAVIILLGTIGIIMSIAMPKFKLIQKLIDRLNLVMRENLTGMMVIRAFNTQDFEENRFEMANRELTDTNLYVNRLMVVMQPIMMLVMNGVSVLIVWVGAHQIANSTMQVGDMMAFMQYAMQIIMSFLMLSMMFIMIPRASVSAQRISEILETEPTISDPESPVTMPKKIKGQIKYDNVTFKFYGAQEPMLKHISFEAKAGEITAFIGSTGAGKSTLMNLLPRFYDVSEGTISIDGVDISTLKLSELRDTIGYVPQKSTLFSGTIETNLKWGKEDATIDEMDRAIRIAQATEIVLDKHEGYDASISQSGNNVSGGQKQRFAIARALIKSPSIFIFDDSFSALDFKTDAALRESLRIEASDSTILLVGQRIASIKNADQIIVLEDGEIVGKGKHQDLMENCETYKEIAMSQLSAEELA